MALAGVLPATWSVPANAAVTFTVNSTGDESDLNLSNTRCDVSPATGRQCTLRAAIEEANDTPGADLIRFNISSSATVKTISPASPLPPITDQVTIDGYTQPGASPNTLATGNDAVLKIQLNGANAGAGASGLTIDAADTLIKGLVINRFAFDGIRVTPLATGNTIQGNFLGTNAAGTRDLGNSLRGVRIEGSNNIVGGTGPGARNVISGNDGHGVFIGGGGNKVEGNRIGTNADGTGDLGNSVDGVSIQGDSDNNTIGGTTSGAANVISGNGDDGIEIFSSTATANKVQANLIRNNGDDGVDVSVSDGNTIGGGNSIIANGGDGVVVFIGGTGNSIVSNQIFSNVELGIDLRGGTEDSFGVTANDTDDPDTGANNLQNFPVITSAFRSFSQNITFITGTLNSNPGQSFTIQCFAALDGDPSNHGEATLVLTSTSATTDANGDSSFTCVTGLDLTGNEVSTTATNTATGDTSEFSLNRTVVPG
jgi:CSLREA domain-containing protein